jgi:hypothetical protein
MTLNDECKAARIALKATKYEPDIKYPSHLVQHQNYHSEMFVVVYKVLLINPAPKTQEMHRNTKD